MGSLSFVEVGYYVKVKTKCDCVSSLSALRKRQVGLCAKHHLQSRNILFKIYSVSNETLVVSCLDYLWAIVTRKECKVTQVVIFAFD